MSPVSLPRSAPGCVQRSISTETNNELLKEITEAEVKAAVFQMHPDKAPGPDGMTPAYQRCMKGCC